MEKDWSLNVLAKDRMMDKIDSQGKILEIGPLNQPFFSKNEFDVYYADIKGTDEVKERYSYLNDESNIVSIDYVITDTYENTFKDEGIKFDYVFLSHVLEHIPDPISFLLDISTVLSANGKICLLLPDKEFTFDHYRENSSFIDMFDMYVRGEKISTPRLMLDSMLCTTNENKASSYWDKGAEKYPAPNVDVCIETYYNFINDFDNQSFDGHYWVFTDRSFLNILENMLKVNLLPYKLVEFFPTPYYTNTFGLILELDLSIQENSEIRKSQINDIHEIIKNISKRRFEIEIKDIITENNDMKDILSKLKNILNESE